jgi:hypothetical protein
MKKRGQKVKLKHNETGQIIEGKVIQYDSIQGYWVEKRVSPNFLNDWKWHNLNEWSEV